MKLFALACVLFYGTQALNLHRDEIDQLNGLSGDARQFADDVLAAIEHVGQDAWDKLSDEQKEKAVAAAKKWENEQHQGE